MGGSAKGRKWERVESNAIFGQVRRNWRVK
jgi:hypothetical protein